jgi:hypothetical protein
MTAPAYSSLFGSSALVPKTRKPEDEEPKVATTATAPPPRPTLTFAQLQAKGEARPAPGMVTPAPTAAPAPAASAAAPTATVAAPPAPGGAPTPLPMPVYGGSAQAQTGRDLLEGQAKAAAASPSRYDTAAFTKMRDAALADLEAQFGIQRQSLDESLASRGLYDSSIAANKYRDLGGQQARAMAGLNAELLRDAATTQAQDRLAAAGLSSNLASLAGSQDLAEFEANRVGQAQDFENQLRAAQFGEGTRQFDVQQALAETLGVGGLGLEERRLAQQGDQFSESLGLERERLSQSGEQFGQTLQLSRDELALRGDLGTQEQELARARLTQEGRLAEAEQNIERERLGQQESQFSRGLATETTQSDLDRQLRELLGMGELDLSREQMAQQGEQFGESLGFQREELGAQTQQSDLERELRERLGLTELSGVYAGADGTPQSTVARDRLAVDREIGGNQTLIQLAQLLGLTGLGTALTDRPDTGGTTGGVLPQTGGGVEPPTGGTTGGDDDGPTGGATDIPEPAYLKLQQENPELFAALMSILGGG